MVSVPGRRVSQQPGILLVLLLSGRGVWLRRQDQALREGQLCCSCIQSVQTAQIVQAAAGLAQQKPAEADVQRICPTHDWASSTRHSAACRLSIPGCCNHALAAVAAVAVVQVEQTAFGAGTASVATACTTCCHYLLMAGFDRTAAVAG